MQMISGGAVLMVLSALTGELSQISWTTVSSDAIGAWVYVTVFGSVAYGSYLWLLKASSPAKAATYAYVNPVIALWLGYLVGDEMLSIWTIGCSTAIVVAVLLIVSR
jgi:drug/metabolite transporter (DMT)-like permease